MQSTYFFLRELANYGARDGSSSRIYLLALLAGSGLAWVAERFAKLADKDRYFRNAVAFLSRAQLLGQWRDPESHLVGPYRCRQIEDRQDSLQMFFGRAALTEVIQITSQRQHGSNWQSFWMSIRSSECTTRRIILTDFREVRNSLNLRTLDRIWIGESVNLCQNRWVCPENHL